MASDSLLSREPLPRTRRIAPIGIYSGFLLSVLITAFLLISSFFVLRGSATSPIGSVLLILSVMMAMASLTALQSALETQRRLAQPDSGAVNEQIELSVYEAEQAVERVKTATLPAIEGQYQEVNPSPGVSQDYDISLGELLNYDQALAFAKMRLDLERELRRIAIEAGLNVALRPVGVGSLARELIDRNVLSVQYAPALDTVVGLANAAIHGTSIRSDEAGEAMNASAQLLELLRNVHVHGADKKA